MFCTFTTNLLQQNLRKLATNGVFTVDSRFSNRFPLKSSQQFELDFCCFYRHTEPINRKNLKTEEEL